MDDGSYDSSDDNLEDIPEDDLNIGSDNENVDKDSQPIFPGASISIGSFMLLLAIFCTKHNITGDVIQQLLNIISLVLPVQNILCKTLHSYKQFFKKNEKSSSLPLLLSSLFRNNRT